MAYKDLHKLKKIAVVEKESIHVKNLVIGKDIFSLSLYTKLKNDLGSDQVRLLSQDQIFVTDLLPKGPSQLRGETNQRLFKELFPEVEMTKSIDQALFYKDMAWKSFGGRSKPEALKYDEGFYTGDRLDPNFEQLFNLVGFHPSSLDSINQEAYQVKIKSIKRNETNFLVECINGTEFHVEQLYFGLSPYHYLQFYTEKNELSDTFIQFCESTKTTSAIFVKYVFEKTPLTDMKETLFIPLSYTHEWGHFIGEFSEKNGQQEIEFMHFIEEQSVTEEDVSRIIRLLKKNMEKIFPNFSKINVKEFIAVEQDIACLKIDDQLFVDSEKNQKNEMKNLSFVGINAPNSKTHSISHSFEYSPETLNGVMRGLVTQSIHTKKL
jgi:hypothetical protein